MSFCPLQFCSETQGYWGKIQVQIHWWLHETNFQKLIFPIIVFVRTCSSVIHDERWAAHIDRTNFFNSSPWGKCIREFWWIWYYSSVFFTPQNFTPAGGNKGIFHIDVGHPRRLSSNKESQEEYSVRTGSTFDLKELLNLLILCSIWTISTFLYLDIVQLC